uniref:DUF4210 domain-containing protein n=1 Tax=Panagrellus redivivus TaxID=6233 RepID=A0A7E4W550_PANRE
MNLVADILTSILEHRIGVVDDGSRGRVAETAKQSENVAVKLALKRADCKKANCEAESVFEVWNLQRLKSPPEGNTSIPLMAMFLKNAIRSQLHFSPFNSCLANAPEKKLPDGYTCDYTIASSANLTTSLPDQPIGSHTFPLCKYTDPETEETFFLAVEVKFVRMSAFPTLVCRCAKSINSPDWILPVKPSSCNHDEDEVPPTPTLDEDVDGFAYFLGLTTPKPEEPRSPTRRSYHARSRRFTATEVPPMTPPMPRPRNSKSFCGTLGSKGVHFHPKTRLPLNSSPAPLKRVPLSLAAKLRARGIVLDSSNGDSSSSDTESVINDEKPVKYGSPQSTHALLCNFEESALKGRLEPVSLLNGFKLQMSVVGSTFSVPHTELPMSTYFFDVSADDAPSLYLGHCAFIESPFGRKAVHIPKKCVIQATLFNPQNSVVRIFLLKVDVTDMPPRSRTFIRQRTVAASLLDGTPLPSGLRYLLHLRLATNRSGKVFMHTDVRLLFSANQTDLDMMNISFDADGNAVDGDASYDLVTSTDMPSQPKYSPLK